MSLTQILKLNFKKSSNWPMRVWFRLHFFSQWNFFEKQIEIVFPNLSIDGVGLNVQSLPIRNNLELSYYYYGENTMRDITFGK